MRVLYAHLSPRRRYEIAAAEQALLAEHPARSRQVIAAYAWRAGRSFVIVGSL